MYAKYFNWLTILIILNVGFFLVTWVISEHINVFGLLSVSSDLFSLDNKPWTIFTYMFFEDTFDFFAWKMILLFFWGRIFISVQSDKQLFATYVLGGVAGVIFLLIMSFLYLPNPFHELFSFPDTDYYEFYGQSPAILAVIVAITTYSPKCKARVFSKKIPIIIIAIITILLELYYSADLHYCYRARELKAFCVLKIGGMLYGFAWGVYQRILKKIHTNKNMQ